MKIALIADDLTGANDSGVQFARNGLKTTVLFHLHNRPVKQADVVIVDTDSRSIPAKDAYQKVEEVSRFIKEHAFEMIYKKIDSTLRGNIGAELDALFDVFRPDFIICSPAYPGLHRTVKDGYLYVGEKYLHETEFAQDPKTPVTESYIPRLIENQSCRKAGLITLDDMAKGQPYVKTKLEKFREKGQTYIVFDAVSNEDLQNIVFLFNKSSYNVVWSGSAGLANHLGIKNQRNKIAIPKSNHPVLTVVGSVNPKTRKQLDMLLTEPNVMGVKLQAHHVVSDEETMEKEVQQAYKQAIEGIHKQQHIVLYSSGAHDEIKLAVEAGKQHGLTASAVSDHISKVLGNTASRLVQNTKIDRIILTGGDTARQFSSSFGADHFELIDEVEAGVPFGLLMGPKIIYAVTKAGGFGSEQVLIHSLSTLQGE